MTAPRTRPEARWQPDFVVIGAAKAATTWIQARLQENPAVYMPDPEPHYFSTDYAEGEGHYRGFFDEIPEGVTCIGEKSADYLAHPEAPARMARMLPHARLVVMLRDPVERAYSDYKMFYRRGTVTGPPEDYLADLANPHPRFLEDGLYARHLDRWLEVFPREQIRIYLHEDLDERPREVLAEVSRHIGLEPTLPETIDTTHENSSRTMILPLPLRRMLAPFKNAARPLRGSPIFEGARSLLAQEMRYPPLSANLRARLCEFYAPDTQRLGTLIERSLDCWQSARTPIPAQASR
ncbi:sulfotransferase family protein [Novosphingobium sp. MBES04]|uniref:sulfotransferase family protein n=1 Tax=Novosphingobium sp. MBES04 TaxID=1206458 RepID=UPI0006935706|nr:sulfotransferase [Novosphingobium sp. MBES04]GAM06073.1 sulfotransferase [Novosphingobium sp. MBES04]